MIKAQLMEKALTYRGTLRDYIILSKPGIIALVLVTTMTGIYIGYRGLPEPSLVFWTLLGTSLAAAGSTVLNNYYDRDIDTLMKRTSSRPLPSGNINPLAALVLGLSLLGLSFLLLSYFVNLLSAGLALTAAFFYVVVYTHLMKRRTPNATVIGGISGALPPVIGYAAVSGTIGWDAVIMFLIMFVWQPPHFWFLAIKHAGDYRKADIPTLPVSKGLLEAKGKILVFNAALFPISLMPYFYGIAGRIYLIVASFLSITYLAFSLRLLLSKGEKNVFRFFYFSVMYLAVIFTVMILDMIKKP